MPPTLKRKRSGSAATDSGSHSDASASSQASADDWQGLDPAPDAHSAPTDPSSSHTVLKPPTGQELRNIKEATDLYRSSSFKFQVRTSPLALPQLPDPRFSTRSTPSSPTSAPSISTPSPLMHSSAPSTNSLLTFPQSLPNIPSMLPAPSPRRASPFPTPIPCPPKTQAGRFPSSLPLRYFWLEAGLRRLPSRAKTPSSIPLTSP